MTDRTDDYFRERERIEREAAKNATCEAARWAHQEMADSYARILAEKMVIAKPVHS